MLTNTDATELIRVIVEHQVEIVGSLAVEQANKVNGIKVSNDLQTISVSGELNDVLNKLVQQYEQLFGLASVEVCRDAVKEVLSKVSSKDLPDILK